MAHTIEELNQLAIDVTTNKVFMTQDANVAHSTFMVVLSLLDDKARDEIIAAKPAAFYEYYDKAGPRSVNGYPSFYSVHWIPEDEWKTFYDIYEQKKRDLETQAQTLRDAGYTVEKRSQ